MRNAQRFTGKTLLAIGGTLILAAPSAVASLTPVHPPHTGELGHVDILNQLYCSIGGAFDASARPGAASCTNSTITATRIDDLSGGAPGSLLHLVFGTPGLPHTDQYWVDGIAQATAEAKFALFSQEFGYDAGSGYTSLFHIAVNGPSGFDVSGAGSVQFDHNVPWVWARAGTGNTYYSANTLNPDGLDHMVTYQVSGLSTTDTVWLLFWEDLPGALGQKSDRDFNDLVVEIRAQVVPLPGTALLAIAGGGMLSFFRRRRRS